MEQTIHSAIRMQQRGIPPLIIDWLQQYGESEYSRRAVIFYFTKRSRKRLAKEFGDRVVSLLSPLLDTYIVMNPRTMELITAGHRFRRIKEKYRVYQ